MGPITEVLLECLLPPFIGRKGREDEEVGLPPCSVCVLPTPVCVLQVDPLRSLTPCTGGLHTPRQATLIRTCADQCHKSQREPDYGILACFTETLKLVQPKGRMVSKYWERTHVVFTF